jgi:hypothetical protein
MLLLSFYSLSRPTPFAMCFEVLFLLSWVHGLHNFHARVQEWPQHKALLQSMVVILASLDVDRKNLLRRSVLVEDWQAVGETIENGTLELERMESIHFAIRYKAATRHGHQLRASMRKLQKVRERVDSLKADLKVGDMHFWDERARTDVELALHFMRQLAEENAPRLKPF